MEALTVSFEHSTKSLRLSAHAGMPRRDPDTTFGNVKVEVIADKEPQFDRGNFCSIICGSHWPG